MRCLQAGMGGSSSCSTTSRASSRVAATRSPGSATPLRQREEKEGYSAGPARSSPRKGQHIANGMAKRLAGPRVLAGKVSPEVRNYLEEKMQSGLSGQITWKENGRGQGRPDP